MIPIKAQDIMDAVGGVLISGRADRLISSACLDTRELEAGDLFIPLKGPNFDGHEFIQEAIAAGAAGFLTQRSERASVGDTGGDMLAIRVPDTLKALHDLAGLIRRRLKAKVIGITGSTGKTSTKEFLASIVGASFSAVASSRNENNEIGVPKTLMKAGSKTDVLVVEMAMRGLGQIASLAALADPDIGIVTNIGPTHIGLLGSIEKIAQAKSELTESLSPSGYAILNADDVWTPFLTERTAAQIVTFGFGPDADYHADQIVYDHAARPSYRLIQEGEPGPTINLQVPGRHNIENSLAAIAAARVLGVKTEQIVGELRRSRPGRMRLDIIKADSGWTIIDDAYNANPLSMAGALDTLMRFDTRGKRIAVLGQMAELGDLTVPAHKEIGTKAAGLGLDVLVAVGRTAADIADSAIQGGLDKTAVYWFEEKEEAADWLDSHIKADDVVLVKGSRVAELEFVVERLS